MSARKYIARGFFLVAAIMVIASLIGSSSRRTVASDTKAVAGIRYGYQLDSYRFRNRMFLRFWNSAGMQLDFDLPGYYPDQVLEARWLPGEGAIYLRLTIMRREDSLTTSAPVKLLYDFRSGEMLLSAP
ncbi:MAG: hypothetical protein ABIP75_19035, partial [Pyrinomonadaceae bacterium]